MTRHLLITGGTRGIGAAVAELALEAGDVVTLTCRTESPESRKIVERWAGRATVELVDAGDVDAVEALVERAVAERGPLDVVVANAAQIGVIGAFVESSIEHARRILDVNVVGVAALAQAAARHWIAEGRPGVIVTLGSVAAQSGAPGEYPVYAASKAAVESLTRGLGRELAEHGIRVVCVAPGTTDTGMHASAGDPDRAARLATRLPFSRVAEPIEVARAVLWAASNDASYVTATTITVAGGQ